MREIIELTEELLQDIAKSRPNAVKLIVASGIRTAIKTDENVYRYRLEFPSLKVQDCAEFDRQIDSEVATIIVEKQLDRTIETNILVKLIDKE